MKKERQLSDELLVKYLLGEVSEMEQKEVENWISQSSVNKNEFDTFRLIWEQSRQIQQTALSDSDAAWVRFQNRISDHKPAPKTIPVPQRNKWLKAAAILLLFAGASWFTLHHNYFSSRQVAVNIQPAQQVSPVAGPTPSESVNPVPVRPVQDQVTTIEKVEKQVNNNSLALAGGSLASPKKKHLKGVKKYESNGNVTKTKINQFICNSTPYPFEICITQSVKCKKNDQPTAISTCSVLEPDQSGQLRYKAFDKIAKNCKATIEEITITKITTGETIVLNDHSTPTTAQNFFNHITGKKKGDVFAGMFHCDGNERIDDCGLTFNSSFGYLSLQ